MVTKLPSHSVIRRYYPESWNTTKVSRTNNQISALFQFLERFFALCLKFALIKLNCYYIRFRYSNQKDQDALVKW